MKTRRCRTPKCPTMLPPGSRQQYCRPCAAERIRESNRQSVLNRAAGIRVPRANANPARQASTQWVCDYLLAHPCACGEARVAALLFIQTDGQRSPVDHAITAGVPLAAVQLAVAGCTVQCYTCWTSIQITARPTFKFAYRLGAMLTQQRSNGQAPSRAVLPPAPQPQEGRGGAGVELQIEAPGPADLPPREDGVEAVPQEPTDGAPQVDVGDDAAAVALGDPVGEAGRGRGHDDAVDAGQERRLEGDGGDGGVVGGVRLIRRPRQR